MKTYDEIVAGNITAARARRKLSQREVAERMEVFGFGWRQQIVAAAENGRRKISIEEMLGLALALETSFVSLLEPVRDEEPIRLPSGDELPTGVIHDLIWGPQVGRVIPNRPRYPRPERQEGDKP